MFLPFRSIVVVRTSSAFLATVSGGASRKVTQTISSTSHSTTPSKTSTNSSGSTIIGSIAALHKYIIDRIASYTILLMMILQFICSLINGAEQAENINSCTIFCHLPLNRPMLYNNGYWRSHRGLSIVIECGGMTQRHPPPPPPH